MDNSTRLDVYLRLFFYFSVDWYAFGIILYSMLVNDHPLYKFKEKPAGWKLPSDEQERFELLLGLFCVLLR